HDTARFFLCLGLSVAALFAPERWADATAAALRDSVLVPFLWLQERAEESKTSRAVFAHLTLERDSAAHAGQFLPALRAENQRLRQLLGLGRRLGTSYVPAEVLHEALPTDGRTLILSAGSRAGVSEFSPVISPDGLIGVVRSAGPARSVAMTWSHPEFRVSAYTENGTVFGVVAPAAQPSGSELLLQLRGVAYRDTIPLGTQVVSSGLGGVYPAGIPIGVVIGLAREETGWERAYLVLPAANPANVLHVLILTAHPDSSVARAFVPDSAP
ncbi:MAG: rod shape-determining protein MreC, partial [Gemmatimonadales bacterium]